jgi:NADH:ubiquinone oxidoreductase subunit 2 (subunit N)
MAGLPPFAGFFGKFLILKTLVANHYTFTTLILIFFSTVSTFYYVRMIKCLIFEDLNFYKIWLKNLGINKKEKNLKISKELF